jgi:hypothetical protein
MDEPNEHERIVEILKRAGRPPEAVTEGSREENLRWLLQVTVPEEKAPTSLRQRVQALATAAPAAPPFPAVATVGSEGALPAASADPRGSDTRWQRLRRRVAPPPLGWRRLLLGAVPLAVASVLLFLLLAGPAPAGVLDRTLQAMARVRSAHCTGWLISYSDKDAGGQPLPGRMNVEWWYQAPDRYRKAMGPKVSGWSQEPGTLIIQGERSLFSSTYSPAGQSQKLTLSPAQLAYWLSPLDFFSRTGLLERARHEQDAQIAIEEEVYRARPIKKITVTVVTAEGPRASRQRWVLWVDPSSERIVRSEVRRDGRGAEGTWEREDEEILDRFEYNVTVPASLVSIEPTPAPAATANDRRALKKTP